MNSKLIIVCQCGHRADEHTDTTCMQPSEENDSGVCSCMYGKIQAASLPNRITPYIDLLHMLLVRKQKRIASQALEAERDAARGNAAEIGAYTLQAFGDRYHLINGHDRSIALDVCSDPTCGDLAATIAALRAAQPEPEAEPRYRRLGERVVVHLETRMLAMYDPDIHGDLVNEKLYDIPTGYTLISPDTGNDWMLDNLTEELMKED